LWVKYQVERMIEYASTMTECSLHYQTSMWVRLIFATDLTLITTAVTIFGSHYFKNKFLKKSLLI
jgi:hypothetical protein